MRPYMNLAVLALAASVVSSALAAPIRTPTIIGRRELPPSDNHNPHAHGPPVNHVNAPNPTDTVQPIPWVSPPIPTDNPNHAHSSLADPIISTYNPWNAPHVLPEGSHGNR